MAIAVLVGSLRKDSITRKIARALEPFMPMLAFEHVEIGNLPLYNQDLDDASPPAAWTAFRDKMRAATGYLFVTPEYNRTIPGALKNALDVGSRPGGKSSFAGAQPGGQRVAVPDGWLRREPSPSPGARVPRCRRAPAAGDVREQGARAARRQGRRQRRSSEEAVREVRRRVHRLGQPPELT